MPSSEPSWVDREAELVKLHVLAYIKHIRFGLGRIQSTRDEGKRALSVGGRVSPKPQKAAVKQGWRGYIFIHCLPSPVCLVPLLSPCPFILCEVLAYIDSQSVVETGLCLTFNIFCLMNNTKNTHKKSDDNTFQRHHQMATKQQACFMSWSLSSFQLVD